MPRACLACGRRLGMRERHLCLSCAADVPYTRFWLAAHNPLADRFNAVLERHRGTEPMDYAYAAAGGITAPSWAAASPPPRTSRTSTWSSPSPSTGPAAAPAATTKPKSSPAPLSPPTAPPLLPLLPPPLLPLPPRPPFHRPPVLLPPLSLQSRPHPVRPRDGRSQPAMTTGPSLPPLPLRPLLAHPRDGRS